MHEDNSLHHPHIAVLCDGAVEINFGNRLVHRVQLDANDSQLYKNTVEKEFIKSINVVWEINTIDIINKMVINILHIYIYGLYIIVIFWVMFVGNINMNN